MSKIKVLIVDNFTLLREALKVVLGSEEYISVVGETVSVDDAVEIIDNQKPDIAFLNFLKPNVAGSGFIKRARKINPSMKFIVFVNGDIAETKRVFFDMKVTGLLGIDVGSEEIKLAVRKVYEGDSYIDARVSQTLFGMAGHQKELKLSLRQLQILRMIAEGFTNKRISAELGISQDTVKTHVRIVLKKLNAADRAQAVSKAYELDILTSRTV